MKLMLVKMTKTFNSQAYARAKTAGYRSGLEDKVADQLNQTGLTYAYESKESKIPYNVPTSDHTYNPDFTFNTSIIVETKGIFALADRKKHLLIKAQHPDKEVRFVFSNSKAKIAKGSKTSYAHWCDKYGFIYADKLIPDEWLEEIRELQLLNIQKAKH